MRLTPGRTALLSLAAVLLLSLFLPASQSQGWFGGHGFGTVLAQQLFWLAWRSLGSPQQPNSEAAVVSLQVVLAVGLFGLVLLAVFAATQGIAPRRRHVVLVALTVTYLAMLFAVPQATFGP